MTTKIIVDCGLHNPQKVYERCIFWVRWGVLQQVRPAGLKKTRRVGMIFSTRQVQGDLASLALPLLQAFTLEDNSLDPHKVKINLHILYP